VTYDRVHAVALRPATSLAHAPDQEPASE